MSNTIGTNGHDIFFFLLGWGKGEPINGMSNDSAAQKNKENDLLHPYVDEEPTTPS